MSLSVLPPSTTTRYSYSLTSKNTKSTISVTKVSPTVSKVSTTAPTDPVYPTFPDVSLKKLPFYKVEEVLLKPSTLQPMGKGKNVKSEHQNFSFHLTPAQISRINTTRFRSNKGLMENRHQIQLRFSLLDTTSDQEDNFPKNVSMKVNGKVCPLPLSVTKPPPTGQKKSPGVPVDITSLCKLSSTSSNTITVSWAVEVGKAHTISIYQVENLTHKDLLDQLKKKGQRQPDYTKALIKQKLSDSDQEISTTSCKVSLACPLGRMRMNTPCRPSTCDHLQCFDAELYLMMNEKKPKWICPVCNKPALMENLLIDGFFQNLVKSPRLPLDEHEIVLHSDASWDPSTNEKEVPKHNSEPTVVYIGQNASKRSIDDLNDGISVGPSKKIKLANAATDYIECIDID